MTGFVLYRALPGDVEFTLSIRDVRKESDLSDYTGEVSANASLRVTDHNNTPYPGGPGPGTVQDLGFPVIAPCVSTASTTIGSSCDVKTTANAVLPNSVADGSRTVWELGQVQVFDGGADGDADSTGDNTLFLTEGVFVP
jgi:hypothetical protein